MRDSLLYTLASAGSGKTYHLVLRYIKLLFAGARPSSILALTFTKKAAFEMAERIQKALFEMAEQKQNHPYVQELMQEGLNLDGFEGQIHSIIAQYLQEESKIMTMDAFFQKILKKFCWYVGVVHAFEIGDEDFKEIGELFLARLTLSQHQALIHLCIKEKRSLQSVLQVCVLLDFFGELFNQALFQKPFSKHHKQELIKAVMQDAKEIQHAFLLSKPKKSCVDFDDLNSLLSAGKTWLTKERLQDYRDFKQLELEDVFVSLKEHLAQLYAQEEAEFLSVMYGLLQTYQEARDAFFASKKMLSFHGLSQKVYTLLSHEQFDCEFLYFRLDGTIDHILIDEFQDTSVLQYKILEPLIEEIKSGKGRRDFARTFFFVGDVKQSIYRFRGGNPRLFEYASKEMAKKELATNYRSAKQIVKFVNEVFSPVYEHFVWQQAHCEEEGYVCVESIEEIELYLLSCIAKLQNQGISKDDIAILAFDNQSVLSIASLLLAHDIACVIETSSKIIAQPEVRALIEMLKYYKTNNPLYAHEFFCLLGIEAPKQDFKQSLDWQSPTKEGALVDLKPHLSYHSPKPYILIYHLMQRYGIFSRSARQLLEYACGFVCLDEFLENIENLNEKIEEKEEHGIKIMTIHKSKGLEFDHVILIDRQSHVRNTKKIFFTYGHDGVGIENVLVKSSPIREACDRFYWQAIQKEQALNERDLLNVLYVGFTRAKLSLHIAQKSKQSAFEPLGLDLKEYGILKSSPKAPTPSFLGAVDFPNKRMLSPFGIQQHMQIKETPAMGANVSLLYGIALHFVLEQKIKNGLEDSLLLLLLQKKMGFYFGLDSLKDILASANLALKNKDFMEILAKGKVKCEIPFLSENRQKRLDLLVENDHEAFVIDYKSGLPNDTYKKQIHEYKKSVSKILKKQVHGYIFYTNNGGKLVQV